MPLASKLMDASLTDLFRQASNPLGNPPPPWPEREGESGDKSHVLIT